jgi:hypothetical protein
MAHLRVFTYNDVLGPGQIYQYECSVCRKLAGHTYVAGDEPQLPIHGPVGNAVCECYYVDIYTPDEPAAPIHTHQELLDQLNAFGPWLDEMEDELSRLAATILDLATRVCVDEGA